MFLRAMRILTCLLAGLLLSTPVFGSAGRDEQATSVPVLTAVMARAAARAGQWQTAARLWRARTLTHVADGEAWAGLGVALLQLKEAGDAAIALERAALLLPEDDTLWLHRGRAALALGDVPAAHLAFAALSTAHPDDARGWIGLGIVHDLNGGHEQARAAYARALTIDPLNSAARHNLALSNQLANENQP